MIGRRAFLAAFLPTLGMTSPVMGTQFHVTGRFDRAGQQGDGYYALGQTLAIMVDPQKLPAMYEQAEKLVGKDARFSLEEA